MGSSSGTSSGLPNSGIIDDKDHRKDFDQKKRKRMISNRDSARRSRMKKQKHLDELLAEASRLSNENNQILNNINFTTELFLKVEAENSVVRAQVNELTHRLGSLNDIINCLNVTSGKNVDYMMNMINPTVINDDQMMMMMNFDDQFMNPLDDWMYFNQQPIMGSDLIMY